MVLTFARDSVARPLTIPGAPAAGPDPGGPPSIFTAVQEQLGLTLESTRAPVDYYVVERAELPAPELTGRHFHGPNDTR